MALLTPTPLPSQTSMLQRLLARTGETLAKEPLLAPVIAFQISVPAPVVGQPTPACVLTVQDGWLTIQPNQASFALPMVRLDLRGYTLRSLVDWFTTQAGGYHATLVPLDVPTELLCATVLTEGIGDLARYGGQTTWAFFTDPNHQWLTALALALADAASDQRLALTQLDQRTASGLWQDWWGQLLGVPRLAVEVSNDPAYRARVQREVATVKSNNVAISQLLQTATGLRSTVVDGGSPFTLPDMSVATSGSPLPDIAGGATISSVALLAPQAGSGSFTVQLLDPLGGYTVSDMTQFVTNWKAAGITFTVLPAPTSGILIPITP